MSKRRPLPAEPVAAPRLVRVIAVARFKHDGIDRRVGDILVMPPRDADDLIAVGFARPASATV